jgi:HEAT repeat protein
MPNKLAHRLVSAALLVWTLGCGRDPAASLIAQLKSPNVETRRSAARELGKVTPLDERAIAALAASVADDDVEVRRLSIAALRRAGPAAAAIVSNLERALEDPEPHVRLSAALAIKDIDPTNRRYQQALVQAMREANGPAMLEVGRMGQAAAWAVPTLQRLLSHDSPKVRSLAARTLGQIGPVAERAERALELSLRDSNVAVQDAARNALDKIQALSSPQPP